MRQINLAIIFALCLAVAIFGLENTDSVTVAFLPGRAVTVPLALALLVSAGVGALLSWMFVIWNRLLRQIEVGRDRSEVRARDERIKALSQDLEVVKAELDQRRQQPLLSADEAARPAAAEPAETAGSKDTSLKANSSD